MVSGEKDSQATFISPPPLFDLADRTNGGGGGRLKKKKEEEEAVTQVGMHRGGVGWLWRKIREEKGLL